VALRSLATGTPGLDRGALLDELTRHAHSVKGGALLVRRQEIAELAGALEARFARDQTSATDRPLPPEAGEALAAIERLAAAHRLGDAPAVSSGGLHSEIEPLVAGLEGEAI
jgi:HPt (histidine-containing phosphotransfer) domain-containing protein